MSNEEHLPGRYRVTRCGSGRVTSSKRPGGESAALTPSGTGEVGKTHRKTSCLGTWGLVHSSSKHFHWFHRIHDCGCFYGTSIRRNKLNGLETNFIERSAYVLKVFGLGTRSESSGGGG